MPSDYQRIEQAIHYLNDHAGEQPELSELAREVGLSSSHFQRLFRRWAGISPKRFLQIITARRAEKLLAGSHSVLDTALACGLSGPGRLHDLIVAIHAVTVFPAHETNGERSITLWVQGINFQTKIWEAMLAWEAARTESA